MKALLLVDLQNDFLPGGSLAVPHADEIIPVANQCSPKFDLVVATQDWHPANHESFASQHPGKVPGDQIQLHGLPQVLWPDHCVADSPGAALADNLNTQGLRKIIYKGTDPRVDSYSGFFDNARRHDTGLEAWLKSHQVRDVFIMGVATDYCILATALDAVDLGFSTHVVKDGCRGVNLQPADTDQAFAKMREAGIGITESASIPSPNPC